MSGPAHPGVRKIAAFVIVLLLAPLVLLAGFELASRAAISLT